MIGIERFRDRRIRCGHISLRLHQLLWHKPECRLPELRSTLEIAQKRTAPIPIIIAPKNRRSESKSKWQSFPQQANGCQTDPVLSLRRPEQARQIGKTLTGRLSLIKSATLRASRRPLSTATIFLRFTLSTPSCSRLRIRLQSVQKAIAAQLRNGSQSNRPHEPGQIVLLPYDRFARGGHPTPKSRYSPGVVPKWRLKDFANAATDL
jgi:hypothetical protein